MPAPLAPLWPSFSSSVEGISRDAPGSLAVVDISLQVYAVLRQLGGHSAPSRKSSGYG